MDTIGQPGPVGLEEHRPVSPAVNSDRTRTTSDGDHEFEILHEGEVQMFFYLSLSDVFSNQQESNFYSNKTLLR